MKNLKSFSIRLSLKFMLLITANAALISLSVVMLINFLIRAGQQEMVKNSCNAIYSEYSSRMESLSGEQTQDFAQTVPYFLTYQIYDSQTEEIIVTNDPFLPLLKTTGQSAKKLYEKDYFLDGDLNIIYYSERFDEKITIAVALNIDNDFTYKIFANLPRAIAMIAIPLLIISFFISFFITRNTIAPVVKITKAAEAMNIENLGQLPVTGTNDEIDQLSIIFNKLFNQLKIDFERERQFSNDVSHELNTPLTVIQGQTNLLLRWGKDDSSQLEKSLESIKRESKSMQAIISNLLQISRIESGKIKPALNSVKVKDVFERIKDEFLEISPSVIFHIEDNDVCITTDEEMLHQIISIFVSNSIKFSDSECSIWLSARMEENKCIIEEKDNGPGISEKALPHIFERFYRADESHSRNIAGSGLGLAIAKSLVTALGGTIFAENNADKGVKFSIVI